MSRLTCQTFNVGVKRQVQNTRKNFKQRHVSVLLGRLSTWSQIPQHTPPASQRINDESYSTENQTRFQKEQQSKRVSRSQFLSTSLSIHALAWAN